MTPGHKKMPLGRKTVTPGHKKVTPGHKKVPRGGRFDSQCIASTNGITNTPLEEFMATPIGDSIPSGCKLFPLERLGEYVGIHEISCPFMH